VVPALKGEEQGSSRSLGRIAVRNALVLGEIALSVILLTATGLVGRSLLFTQSIPLGFDRQRHLLFFDLIPGLAGYDPARSQAFFQQVEERAAAQPGVRHATLARRVLLSDSGGGAQQRVAIPGVGLPQGQSSVPIKFNAVDAAYFQTMGTRLLFGREFIPADNSSPNRVV